MLLVKDTSTRQTMRRLSVGLERRAAWRSSRRLEGAEEFPILKGGGYRLATDCPRSQLHCTDLSTRAS